MQQLNIKQRVQFWSRYYPKGNITTDTYLNVTNHQQACLLEITTLLNKPLDESLFKQAFSIYSFSLPDLVSLVRFFQYCNRNQETAQSTIIEQFVIGHPYFVFTKEKIKVYIGTFLTDYNC